MESSSFVAVATAILTVVSMFLGSKYRKWLERGRLFAELFDDIVAAAARAHRVYESVWPSVHVVFEFNQAKKRVYLIRLFRIVNSA